MYRSVQNSYLTICAFCGSPDPLFTFPPPPIKIETELTRQGEIFVYECPNCGGNLKFDIESQLLQCEHCLTTQDPYSTPEDQGAEEHNDFDVTVFTCPQCGGEILSTDTSAAEFCSFCGASTILHSRISRQLRPSHIIPFKMTKDACKKAYLSRMRRALFAPNELKDEKHIDGFRGIYMPYWAYSITQKGPVSMKGEKSYRKGDYIYTDHYDLTGEIDASYYDISYDASSSFSDSISERIAPFNVRDSRKFTPAFLSGFYADTADVDSGLYKQEAIDLANSTSGRRVKSTPAFSGLKFPAEGNSFATNIALNTYCHEPERVMYPVWFLSYRKDGRVAYATVNGQNGRIAADIPMDIRKYLTGSALLAVPIFFLLNLFLTIKPTLLLSLSGLLAGATLILYLMELSDIYRRDQKMDDRGYLFRQNGRIFRGKPGAVNLRELLSHSAFPGKSHVPAIAGPLLSLLVTVLIHVINPVSDLWYYGGTILSYVGILSAITAIIQKYNILATRKLPQFQRHGGDDYAK